jgi:phosphoribosyl 1,2-cyclic phosphodiesterase
VVLLLHNTKPEINGGEWLQLMSDFSFCVLGSGSSGNCSLLHLGDGRWVMIDAGFSMKQTKQRMRTHDISMDMVGDLVLTHLDRDHFNPVWCKTIARQNIKIHIHKDHVPRATRAGIAEDCIVPFEHSIDLHGTTVETIQFAHDMLGTSGFIFDNGDVRFGFATDLGRVPPELLDRYVDLDAIAFESNYDPTMQLQSSRPQFLVERIMGGDGHLSNAQSMRAIEHIASQSNLQHIVLLHLSSQCNTPSIIREMYQDQLPQYANYLTISHQDRCSRLLCIGSRQQETAIVDR